MPIWVEIRSAQLFWRRRFLNFVNVFSVLSNYFPLVKGVALHLNKLEFPSRRDALCQIWLKFAKWFAMFPSSMILPVTQDTKTLFCEKERKIIVYFILKITEFINPCLLSMPIIDFLISQEQISNIRCLQQCVLYCSQRIRAFCVDSFT